ncbi:hypothetical protein NQ318_005461, partial [Aromia moschata]
MRGLHTQNPEKVNVWAGVIGESIIGPFLDWNRETYLALLQNNIPHALQSPDVDEVTTEEINTSTAQYGAETDDPRVETSADGGPFSIEILRIIVPPGIGNAVKLVWGRRLDDLHLNFTYGLHYGIDGEDLTSPKLTTNNLSAVIEDLEFCTKYRFAVSVAANSENRINPNNVRTIVTYADGRVPRGTCGSTSSRGKSPVCSSNGRRLVQILASPSAMSKPSDAYTTIFADYFTDFFKISAFEQGTSRYTIVTLPASKRVDFAHRFKASYEARYDVKVSTNFPASRATDVVAYKVPGVLQPYKVKVTSNPDGAFLVYWSEPFVPPYIDRVYYEVYIYRGANMSNYEKYYVTRPALVYKGNESEYSFSVGLVSYDEQYRSLLTDPIVANSDG